MIPSAVEIARALYGCWRLAHLDKAGLAFFDTSHGGFYRSFFAAVICLPGFAIILALYLVDSEVTAGPFRIVVILLLIYVIAWVLFPLLVFYICRSLGREEEFPRYIVAYNWAQVLIILINLPEVALAQTGWLAGGLDDLLTFAVFLLTSFYIGYIAAVTLRISGFIAAGLVAMDIVVSQILFSLGFALLG